MSRQFRFYLLPEDIRSIVSELKANIDARLLDMTSDSSQPREIEDPIRQSTSPLGSNATCVNCYIAPANGEIRMAYYSKRNEWIIQTDSEAIEFSGCDFNEKVLVIGRLYFQTDMLIEDSIWRKRSEFLAWGDRVFRFVKKRLTYSPRMMAYVGSTAAKWRKEGGKFASGVYPRGVAYEADED